MKKERAIMVALSAAVIAPALPLNAFGQVQMTCPVSFKIGNIAKCLNNGTVVIDPDGGLKSTVGCVYLTNNPIPAVCTISAAPSDVTKSVKVDFTSPSAIIAQGGDNFLLDRLRMSYTGAPTPAKTITLPSTKVNGGATVTIKIGGRIHPIGGSTLGLYTGTITVRANPL